MNVLKKFSSNHEGEISPQILSLPTILKLLNFDIKPFKLSKPIKTLIFLTKYETMYYPFRTFLVLSDLNFLQKKSFLTMIPLTSKTVLAVRI